jgi:prepilin-type N-terminal cleavage/methylation domain-containing protein/prepilin-type processing-associated H-X9-DG protein
MHLRRRTGFSLVEVLVVLGIIGVLLGLLLPAVQQTRQAAARASCQDHLRQTGLALHGFHAVNGAFPAVDNHTSLSWMVAVLPYLEQESLYAVSVAASQTDSRSLDNPPHLGLATVISVFVCPDDSRLLSPLADSQGLDAAFTSYIGNGGGLPAGASVGLAGIFGDSSGVRLSDITDGTSTTLLVGERFPPGNLQAGLWYPGYTTLAPGYRGPNVMLIAGLGNDGIVDPACFTLRGTFGLGRLDNPCDRFHYWSLHTGGANFLFADGSVHFLSYSAEPLIIPLSTRSGGEPVSLP